MIYLREELRRRLAVFWELHRPHWRNAEALLALSLLCGGLGLVSLPLALMVGGALLLIDRIT